MLTTTAVMLPTIHNMKRSYNNTVYASYMQQMPQFLHKLILTPDG